MIKTYLEKLETAFIKIPNFQLNYLSSKKRQIAYIISCCTGFKYFPEKERSAKLLIDHFNGVLDLCKRDKYLSDKVIKQIYDREMRLSPVIVDIKEYSNIQTEGELYEKIEWERSRAILQLQ